MRVITLGLLLALMLGAQPPRHEVAFTLGGMVSPSRTSAGSSVDLGRGTAFQVNYGFRLAGDENVALYIGTHFLASPQRLTATPLGAATRDIASLYLTPNATVKLRPAARIVPWGTFGGGYALYEQSTTRIDGQPNAAPRSVHTGAWMFGGGLDIQVLRFLALRAEVRDFISGSPAYNLPVTGLQQNIVAGGGFILRF